MTLGATLDWENDMGTLISSAQLSRVEAHVRDAVAHGAQVLAGGRARPDLAPHYFEPTILAEVTPQMSCFGEETFGPVVSVYRFAEEEEALTRANDGDYGLNGSIYCPRHRAGPCPGCPAEVRVGQHQRGLQRQLCLLGSPMGGMRCRPAWGVAKGLRASTGSPRPRPWPPSDCCRCRPPSGAPRKNSMVMVTSMKLLKRLGRA